MMWIHSHSDASVDDENGSVIFHCFMSVLVVSLCYAIMLPYKLVNTSANLDGRVDA